MVRQARRRWVFTCGSHSGGVARNSNPCYAPRYDSACNRPLRYIMVRLQRTHGRVRAVLSNQQAPASVQAPLVDDIIH